MCLLVVTTEDAVARWAATSIELGPGTRCVPWVVGPSNTPAITTVNDAKENVELAVLSAIEHGQHADIPLAARVAAVAILASAALDPERSRLYHDLIFISLANNVPEALEATMNSLQYEYRSDFLRRHVAEGIVRGKAEYRIEIILKLLTLRFGVLPADLDARLRGAQGEQLDTVIERMMVAQTLVEALAPLP